MEHNKNKPYYATTGLAVFDAGLGAFCESEGYGIVTA